MLCGLCISSPASPQVFQIRRHRPSMQLYQTPDSPWLTETPFYFSHRVSTVVSIGWSCFHCSAISATMEALFLFTRLSLASCLSARSVKLQVFCMKCKKEMGGGVDMRPLHLSGNFQQTFFYVSLATRGSHGHLSCKRGCQGAWHSKFYGGGCMGAGG